MGKLYYKKFRTLYLSEISRNPMVIKCGDNPSMVMGSCCDFLFPSRPISILEVSHSPFRCIVLANGSPEGSVYSDVFSPIASVQRSMNQGVGMRTAPHHHS